VAAFLRIVQIMSKYGPRATKWCWDNKGTILKWINAGMGIEWIVNQIRKLAHV
jgi:hypothetical protein